MNAEYSSLGVLPGTSTQSTRVVICNTPFSAIASSFGVKSTAVDSVATWVLRLSRDGHIGSVRATGFVRHAAVENIHVLL